MSSKIELYLNVESSLDRIIEESRRLGKVQMARRSFEQLKNLDYRLAEEERKLRSRREFEEFQLEQEIKAHELHMILSKSWNY